MSGGRGLGGLTEGFWQRAARQLTRLFDGRCEILRLELLAQAGVCFAGDWRVDKGEKLPEDLDEKLGEEKPEDMGQDMAAAQAWPCHLDLRRRPPAGLPEDGSGLTGSGRLFLALEAPEPPAGSRLHIVQRGRKYDLICSGPVVKYPTHMELEVRLMPGSA